MCIRDRANSLNKIGKSLNLSNECLHLKTGYPKTEIIITAEKLKADLIIVGSHGRHGLATLLGSTTNSILHNATCDVLTIKATKKNFCKDKK